MKVYLRTLSGGCIGSLAELSLYRKALEKTGHEIAESVESADAVVLNTCGFTGEMESNSLKAINDVKRNFPQKRVVVGGCLPKISPTPLKIAFQGPIFQPERLDEFLRALGESDQKIKAFEASGGCERPLGLDPRDFRALNFQSRMFYFVLRTNEVLSNFFRISSPFVDNLLHCATVNPLAYQIQVVKGCLGKCTFCSIPKSRGSLISTPLETILQDVDEARAHGKRAIVLRGEDAGAWGQDIGSDITVLLDAIYKRAPELSVHIPFIEPMWLVKYFDRLRVIFARGQVIGFFLPIQSGSDRIVRRMGRRYSSKEVVRLISILRKENPNLVLKTHIVHSFPGETWRDFFLSLYYGAHFDFIMVIPWSPRPDTPALKLPGRISRGTMEIRRIVGLAVFAFWSLARAAKGALRLRVKRVAL